MKVSEMISMPECRWVRAHLTQYLDQDPSAPLSSEEISRIDFHIALCEKCSSISEDYREITKSLRHYRKQVDRESIQRLSDSLKKITTDD